MRARLGIDKMPKSWADWVEEEEEEAEFVKASAAAKPLSMRLRGGCAKGESGDESGEESGEESGDEGSERESTAGSEHGSDADDTVDPDRILPGSSSPASSLSDEGTDTGEPAMRRKRPRMSDESNGETPRLAA